MSIQGRLDLHKHQQEKSPVNLTIAPAQATSSSSGDARAQKSTSQPPPKSSPDPDQAPVAVKFSSDTERLQRINAIRNAPVGAQIKSVVELLRKTRQALTPEQINEACYVDINRNKAVFASLRNNPKVVFDGEGFSYKPTHHLRGKEQLLSLIRKFPEGLSVADVKDAYPSVMEDLQALREAGLVRVLSNLEAKEDVVYPDDPKAAMEVDDALKQLFRSVELPGDMLDLERELQRSGIRPATDTAARRRAAGRGLSGAKFVRKREIRKRTKLTNVHLPELFRNLNLPRT